MNNKCWYYYKIGLDKSKIIIYWDSTGDTNYTWAISNKDNVIEVSWIWF